MDASLNDTSIFDFSAFDTDGDSLQYEFYQDPWISNYFPGYSYNKPFGLNSYVNLNSSTGTLAFVPQGSGKYFICIRVNEFRNGNLIGFVTKEIVCFVSTNNSNCLSTNIYENSISKVNVFPNPSSAIVHIKGANNVKIVSLMDISGKNIQAIPHDKLKNELDISSIKNGVYFLKIQTIHGIITKKLIVAH